MQILESCSAECAIALGNFDGLHKAHMAIINACKSFAAENKIKCGVLLFDRHTSALFGKGVKLLTDMNEKLALLEKSGVDFVHIVTFNRETASLLPNEFIDGILAKFNVHTFFAGYDYTFGRGASGSAESLAEYGRKKGFAVSVTPRMLHDGERISSSLIRNLLENGNTERAEQFLGRYYSVSGEVVVGMGNGKKSLFPTANIAYGEEKFLPSDGVYAGAAEIKGKIYKTAVNIGKNPTLDAKLRTVEAYILDFEGELYGENITVEFIKKLRDDRKFSGFDELKKQIEKDIDAVRKIEIKEKTF